MAELTTLYIGLNDKDTHKQEIKTDEAIELINNIFNDWHIDSFTLQVVTGFYKGEQETTLKIESTENIYYTMINVLKSKLNQECILETTQQMEVEYV